MTIQHTICLRCGGTGKSIWCGIKETCKQCLGEGIIPQTLIIMQAPDQTEISLPPFTGESYEEYWGEKWPPDDANYQDFGE